MFAHTHKIELRGIKHMARLSEETFCYSADLYVDGTLLAQVSNHGHGGCDMVHPAKGRSQSDIDAIEAWIDATMPEKDTGMLIEGKPFMMKPTLESICSGQVADFLTAKDLTKLLARTVAFITDTGEMRSYTGKIPAEQRTALCLQTAQKYPGCKVLNVLPFDQALALYRKTGEQSR